MNEVYRGLQWQDWDMCIRIVRGGGQRLRWLESPGWQQQRYQGGRGVWNIIIIIIMAGMAVV